MLITENLYKKFIVKEKKGLFSKASKKEVQAISDMSLRIEKGQIVGLLGINGAGKSTTIKMLAGILEPTSGSITINGINVVKDSKKVKNHVNIISGGERNLYWRLTARENLEYFGALYGIKKQELNNRIDYLLDLVGLKDAENAPVERYSKGMKQRLQIARGLINNPDYIFLDEPTLGLDISIAKDLRLYIKKLCKEENKGILLTTHYINEAEELCDYIYIVEHGKIINEGTFTSLKEQLKTKIETTMKVTDVSVNLKNDLSDFGSKYNISIEYIENNVVISSDKNYIGKIVKIFGDNNTVITELKIKEPSLEDILLTTISGGK